MFCNPKDCSWPAPLSIGFPRREYWIELPFPSPGDLPDPGIEPMSPALEGGFFITEPPRKLINVLNQCIFQSGDLPFD